MITVKAIRNLSDGSQEIRRVPISLLPGELTFNEVYLFFLKKIDVYNDL
jgi:hypothetical protein